MADVRLTATNPEDSSVVPVACDASGRLLLEERGEGPPGPPGPEGPPGQDGKDGDPFSGNFDGDVTFGGNAEFAGNVNAKAAIDINKGGSKDGVSSALVIWNDSGSSTSVDIKGNGSATFAGQAEFGSDTFSSHSIYASNNQWNTATIVAKNKATGGYVFAGWDASNNQTTLIKNDGSATFAGNITSTYSGNSNTFTATGSITGSAAHFRSNVTNNGSSTDYHAYFDAADGKIVSISTDGSATFAGNKAGFTAEGNLWCTTRRGDTVILDFTSNGTGVWADYTPTSRIDEIRDKLDANRLDTGEMPADTP